MTGVSVPNGSSTAVTCNIASSGSPTLCRAIPSNLSLWPLRPARSPRSMAGAGGTDHQGDHRSIATRHWGIHLGAPAVSRRLSSTFSALTS